MTNFKFASKKYLFVVLCSLIIVAGMIVGTVCHFVAGGFVNYGSEFTSYQSVTVTYLAAEQTEDEVKTICSDAFSGLKAYEVSTADVSTGGVIVYKFTTSTDTATLQSATDKINQQLSADSGLSTAVLQQAETLAGGVKVLNMAAIALASAVAFQFIYMLFRYKLKAALSALLANIHNLGLFVALVAITRLPVGIEVVALGTLTVLLTMIASTVLFDRVKKNDRKASKDKQITELAVIDTSANEGLRFNAFVVCFFIIAIAVTAILGVIAAAYITALAPYAAALLAILSVVFGSMYVAPAVYSIIRLNFKKSKKANKVAKSEKSVKVTAAD